MLNVPVFLAAGLFASAEVETDINAVNCSYAAIGVAG